MDSIPALFTSDGFPALFTSDVKRVSQTLHALSVPRAVAAVHFTVSNSVKSHEAGRGGATTFENCGGGANRRGVRSFGGEFREVGPLVGRRSGTGNNEARSPGTTPGSEPGPILEPPLDVPARSAPGSVPGSVLNVPLVYLGAYSIDPKLTANLQLVCIGVQAIKQIHMKWTANFHC